MTEPAGVKQEAESDPKKAEEEPKTTADRSPLTRARSSGIRRIEDLRIAKGEKRHLPVVRRSPK